MRDSRWPSFTGADTGGSSLFSRPLAERFLCNGRVTVPVLSAHRRRQPNHRRLQARGTTRARGLSGVHAARAAGEWLRPL